MGKHLSINMGYWTEDMKNPWSNSERLWELLFQRGFREREELHEPSSTGHVYLTFFQFCTLIFDPGGHLFRFEDESFQEGGNDRIPRAKIRTLRKSKSIRAIGGSTGSKREENKRREDKGRSSASFKPTLNKGRPNQIQGR